MQSITSEDLLLYLYGETSSQQSKTIATALQHDWDLKEKYDLLKGSMNQLDEVSYAPEQKTIDSILAYAHKSVEELVPQP
jgi:hypothetical protein